MGHDWGGFVAWVLAALGLRALFRLSWLPGSLAAPYVERARTDRGWPDAGLAWYRASF